MQTPYSVGLPVRNEENNIVQCIESLLDQSISPRAIHVCVNGSSDKTYQLVSDMAKVETSIDVLTSEPGKAKAWNEIVANSDDAYMLFTDGDVVINQDAARHLLNKLNSDNRLAIVGGAKAYYSNDSTTFFSRYFTENISGNSIAVPLLCGSLYLAHLPSLKLLAIKKNVQLIPDDIINEDQFLGLLASDYKKNIVDAYATSMQISTFQDWFVATKRHISGTHKLKKDYPQIFTESSFSVHYRDNYLERFKNIPSFSNKLGLFSLFCLRQALSYYYPLANKLDFNCIWEETSSTKSKLPHHISR
jgi:glycosyltransferase involved in cell wall biosynthesis